MNQPMIELHCQFRYEAAHYLPQLPADHQCHRMHGHSYGLTVTVRGPVCDDGFVEDFSVIKDIVGKHVTEQLDHRLLNEILDNPTVEHQLIWMWQQLADHIPGLHRLTLQETATNSATLETQ